MSNSVAVDSSLEYFLNFRTLFYSDFAQENGLLDTCWAHCRTKTTMAQNNNIKEPRTATVRDPKIHLAFLPFIALLLSVRHFVGMDEVGNFCISYL